MLEGKEREGFEVTGKRGDMERKRQIRAKGNTDRMETDRESSSLERLSLQDPVYIVLSVFICHFSISSSPHFFSFRFS